MKASLHSVGRSSGRTRCLDDLDSLSATQHTTLTSAGFRYWIESEADVCSMAEEAARCSLARSGIDASDIGGVIIATESLWDGLAPFASNSRTHIGLRNEMLQSVSQRLRLTNVDVHGVWMAGCGNLGPALRTARALVLSQEAKHILVISCDRVAASSPRLLQGGNAIFSDVAAACLVSEFRKPFDWNLVAVVTFTSTAILQAQRASNFLLVALELRKALSELDQRLAAKCGRRMRDFSVVVTENLNQTLVTACCAAIGIVPESVCAPTRGKTGHAFSSDLLLSLEEILVNSSGKPQMDILAISISSWTLSAIILSPESS